jgi:hypothetical protein
MAENLYCPRCATAFTTGTSFCRSCGLELKRVAEIVKGDAGNVPTARRGRSGMGAFGIGFGLFILGLVVGILNAIIRDFGLFPERYGKMVFLLLIAAGLLILGYWMISQITRYSRSARHNRQETEQQPALETAPLVAGELPPADTSELQPIDFPAAAREPVMAEPSSVTEHTTRHLK